MSGNLSFSFDFSFLETMYACILFWSVLQHQQGQHDPSIPASSPASWRSCALTASEGSVAHKGCTWMHMEPPKPGKTTEQAL